MYQYRSGARRASSKRAQTAMAYYGGFQARARSTGSRQKIRRSQRGYVRTSGFFRGRKATGVEKKFYDINLDDAVVATAGGTLSLPLIAQGTGEENRIGRKCTLTDIGFRYAVTLPSTTNVNNTSDILRVMIVQDKQCNGVLASVSDIIYPDYKSFNELSNKSRFRTLYDQYHELNADMAGGDTTNDSSVVTQFYSVHKKVNIPLEYSSTTGAITEIRSNNIVVLYISKNGLVGVDAVARLRFTDL